MAEPREINFNQLRKPSEGQVLINVKSRGARCESLFKTEVHKVKEKFTS